MTMTPSVSWAKYEFEIISKKKGFFQEFSVGECEKEFILFLPLGNVVKVWIIPKKKCLISKSFLDVNDMWKGFFLQSPPLGNVLSLDNI